MATWRNLDENLLDIYDWEYSDLKEDIFFYQEIYEKYKPENLLEIGAGTGRITIQLLKQNIGKIDVNDISTNALKRLKEKAKNENVLEKIDKIYSGDFLTIDNFEKKYDMVIIPFNTFFLFAEYNKQIEVLKKIKKILQSKGKLIFDVFPPHIITDKLKPGENFFHQFTKVIKETGEVMTRFDKYYFDILLQKIYNLSIYDLSSVSGELWRYYFTYDIQLMNKNELEYILQSQGFNINNIYGDFLYNDLTQNSKKMIFICEAI